MFPGTNVLLPLRVARPGVDIEFVAHYPKIDWDAHSLLDGGVEHLSVPVRHFQLVPRRWIVPCHIRSVNRQRAPRGRSAARRGCGEGAVGLCQTLIRSELYKGRELYLTVDLSGPVAYNVR